MSNHSEHPRRIIVMEHPAAVLNERGEVVNGTEVIQAAWDLALATGAEVHLGRGTYHLRTGEPGQ